MTAQNAPAIWVLDEGRTGDTNNRRAVAQTLSPHVTLIEPYFIKSGSNENIPDIFITGEEASVSHAEKVKEITSGHAFIVGMQTPDIDNNDFDKPRFRNSIDMQVLFRHNINSLTQVVSPAWDVTKPRLAYDYVPSSITPAVLKEAFGHLVKPIKSVMHHKPVYVVLVGSGINENSQTVNRYAGLKQLIEDNIRIMIQYVVAVAEKNNGSVLVTTSRRTDPAVVKCISEMLQDVPHFLHDWRHPKTRHNIFPEMLVVADVIVTMADSITMTMEALATSKPTYLFVPSFNPKNNTQLNLNTALKSAESLLKKEVTAYMEKLADDGLVLPLHQLSDKQLISRTHLNSAQQIGRDVLQAWQNFKTRQTRGLG